VALLIRSWRVWRAAAAAVLVTVAVMLGSAGPAGAQTDPSSVAAGLARTLVLPTPVIGMSPAPSVAQLVNGPSTWLWLQPPWQPLTATGPAGDVTVATVAQPAVVIFDMGNGDKVTCNGPGVPYNPLLPSDAQQTYCSYAYRTSSAHQPGDRFWVTASVYWQVGWLASNDPSPKALGPLVSRSQPVAVRVAEGGGLNTDPGPQSGISVPGGINTPPRATTDTRPRKPPSPPKKKDDGGILGSIWGGIKKAPGAALDVAKKAPGAAWDATKAVGRFGKDVVVGAGKGIWTGLTFTKDLVVGFGKGAWAFGHGLISMADGLSKLLMLHGWGVFIKTWKGLGHTVLSLGDGLSKLLFLHGPGVAVKTWKGFGKGAWAFAGAFVEPMVDAWKHGRPGEAIGRGIFDIGSLIVGTKGLDKLNKLRKVGKVTEGVETAEALQKAKALEEASKLGKLGEAAEEVTGPGKWAAAGESLKERAAAYQRQITGANPDLAYWVKGVKFDGFKGGKLLDAKGPGYAKFLSKGKFEPWWDGSEELVKQARRQLAAANGTPVRWPVAEQDAAVAIRNLLRNRGITQIDVVHVPANAAVPVP